MSQLHSVFLRHDRLAPVRSHGSYRGAKKRHKRSKNFLFQTSPCGILANMPLAEASHMTEIKLKGGRTEPLGKRSCKGQGGLRMRGECNGVGQHQAL